MPCLPIRCSFLCTVIRRPKGVLSDADETQILGWKSVSRSVKGFGSKSQRGIQYFQILLQSTLLWSNSWKVTSFSSFMTQKDTFSLWDLTLTVSEFIFFPQHGSLESCCWESTTRTHQVYKLSWSLQCPKLSLLHLEGAGKEIEGE